MRRLAMFVLTSSLAVATAGCDDTNERRAAAILETRSADVTEGDHGAAELAKILEKSPRDRLALYALAQFHQKRGRSDEARYLYERLAIAGAGFEEGERAKEELVKLALPAASAAPPASAIASGSSDAPNAPQPIVFGKSAGRVSLGMTRAAVDEVLPRHCERSRADADGATVCQALGLGMEIVYKADKVTRIGLFGPGRELVGPGNARTPWKAFVGGSSEGIELGMPATGVEAKLGAPAAKRAPVMAVMTRDGAITAELWDYPKKGVTLEIDKTRSGPIVSGIELPTVEGRPLPTTGNKP